MRRPNAGLTQLELLVSLALMSLMATLTIAGMGFVQRASDSSSIFSASTDGFLVQEQLRDWAARIPAQTEQLSRQTLLSGDQTSLKFETILNDGLFWPGELVQVEISQSPELGDLVVFARGLSDAHRDPIETRRIVARSPTELTIRYYGGTESTQEKWQDGWSFAGNLPRLIKIEWSTKSGEAMPPLILKPAWREHQSFKSLSSFVPPG